MIAMAGRGGSGGRRRNPGTTVMTWNYRDFGGPEHGPAPKGRHCVTVTHVRFRIVVTGLD
jgi:hypothetical protein